MLSVGCHHRGAPVSICSSGTRWAAQIALRFCAQLQGIPSAYRREYPCIGSGAKQKTRKPLQEQLGVLEITLKK